MSSGLPATSSQHASSEQELRKRTPRLQTSPTDSKNTAATDASNINPPLPTTVPSAEPNANMPIAATGHQRFVLTDPVAFRYLEEDPSTTVLSRRQQLEGYEVYLVEQWACSRNYPTFIITTYTGDPKDSVWASVISVPTDESAWSPQLRVYFNALGQYHARRKQTNLGTLMITNLSGFPSSLTVIPIPGGDVRKNRELFFVNENLKRLGCSGRLGIKLAPPSSATQAKFHQLYRTSDKIPLNSSVIELVKLCQVALVMFGKLEPEYADGLLCDVTEKAVNDWWLEFGAEYYTIEPHDGILGPTTVAALLGMLMGARNRLGAFNAPVSKDVFDIESLKRGIAHFQKTQRIEKTRRFDRHTLEKLRRATAKAASKEGWAVPRAFKSTVAELGGKGGEMVMGMVGAGDKAGIADIETVDIDRFVELVQGERSKWLWYGKPRKSNTGDMFNRLPDEDGAISQDEGTRTTSRLLKRESTLATLEGHGAKRDVSVDDEKRFSDLVGPLEVSEKEKDPGSKRAAFRRATDKIESNSGFSRIKDVVGRRSHQPKASKDENSRFSLQYTKSDLGALRHDGMNGSPPPFRRSLDLRSVEQQESRPTSWARSRVTDYETSITKTLTEIPGESGSTLAFVTDGTSSSRHDEESRPKPSKPSEPSESDLSKPPTVENSIAGSIYRDIDPSGKLPLSSTSEIPPSLRRTQTADPLAPYHSRTRNEGWWPRHLSFSIAEESVLTWPSLITPTPDTIDPSLSLRQNLAAQELLTEHAKHLGHQLSQLSKLEAKWTESRVQSVSGLDEGADADIQELEDMYYPRFDTYQSLCEDAHEIVSRERLQLQEAIRDLETLGAKLEYEINTLRSKADDVEDGVQELERQVEFVESKYRELEGLVGEREGWTHFLVRVLFGIGTKPGA